MITDILLLIAVCSLITSAIKTLQITFMDEVDSH